MPGPTHGFNKRQIGFVKSGFHHLGSEMRDVGAPNGFPVDRSHDPQVMIRAQWTQFIQIMKQLWESGAVGNQQLSLTMAH